MTEPEKKGKRTSCVCLVRNTPCCSTRVNDCVHAVPPLLSSSVKLNRLISFQHVGWHRHSWARCHFGFPLKFARQGASFGDSTQRETLTAPSLDQTCSNATVLPHKCTGMGYVTGCCFFFQRMFVWCFTVLHRWLRTKEINITCGDLFMVQTPTTTYNWCLWPFQDKMLENWCVEWLPVWSNEGLRRLEKNVVSFMCHYWHWYRAGPDRSLRGRLVISKGAISDHQCNNRLVNVTWSGKQSLYKTSANMGWQHLFLYKKKLSRKGCVNVWNL